MAFIGEGQLYDRRGIPIYGGDLVKSPHFTDRRRKRHYLYHVAVLVGDHIEMIPPCHLDPREVSGGGRFWPDQKWTDKAEIIHGFGPGDILDYNDRPRRKRTTQ